MLNISSKIRSFLAWFITKTKANRSVVFVKQTNIKLFYKDWLKKSNIRNVAEIAKLKHFCFFTTSFGFSNIIVGLPAQICQNTRPFKKILNLFFNCILALLRELTIFKAFEAQNRHFLEIYYLI